MSDGATDKIKGKTNEIIGKAKRGVGEALDDKDLKDAGTRQEVKGAVQTAVGNVKDALDKATKL
jgi:uncharacterized protein YjbJ (UPF0337 family)